MELEKALPHYTPAPIEGVFIRAPQIESVGNTVRVLLTHKQQAVFVRERNIFAGSFHPELSAGRSVLHELFLSALG